jgi:hypothetical protein
VNEIVVTYGLMGMEPPRASWMPPSIESAVDEVVVAAPVLDDDLRFRQRQLVLLSAS